jgi:hypothetical protein
VMLDPPRPLGFIFYGIILRVFDTLWWTNIAMENHHF